MKRIIISRTDRIGDVVLTTAILQPLHEKFPQASIRLLVQPGLTPLFEDDPRVEAVACSSSEGAKGFHPTRFNKWRNYFKEHPADVIIFLHPDNDLQLAAAAAGLPRRIGYRKQLGKFGLNESIPYTRHLGHKHEGLCNFDLLEKIGCEAPQSLRPELLLSGSGSTPAKPYAVFHPAAHGKKPRWPAAQYADLAEELIQRYSWKIVLTGAAPSTETAQLLHQKNLPPDSWEDRGGKDSLKETATLLKNAKVVVSRDSGPAHLAATVGAPLVCLMGQCDPIHSPKRWAPIGKNVQTLISDLPPEKGESREDRWRRCFEAISMKQVLTAINEVIPD